MQRLLLVLSQVWHIFQTFIPCILFPINYDIFFRPIYQIQWLVWLQLLALYPWPNYRRSISSTMLHHHPRLPLCLFKRQSHRFIGSDISLFHLCSRYVFGRVHTCADDISETSSWDGMPLAQMLMRILSQLLECKHTLNILQLLLNASSWITFIHSSISGTNLVLEICSYTFSCLLYLH
jgi:hypothetical protein